MRQKWNLNKNKTAIELVTQLLKEPQSNFVKEEALYLRGSIYIQEKQIELSLKDWNEALKTLSDKKYKSELMSKILWKKAWLLRQEKKYEEAIKAFEDLKKVNQNIYTDFKVLFWLGKTYLDLKQKQLARNNFLELIEKDYFGYYGLLARKILNKKLEIGKTSLKKNKLFQNKKAEAIIHWLVLFDESELLSKFLKIHVNHFLKKDKLTETEWLETIWLLAKAKQYLQIFQSLELMGDKTKKIFLTKYIYLLFPIDFYEDVNVAHQKWDVDKALIFSIIRQESAFNVRARSPADAFGLMQLIPSTANQTAQKNNIPYKGYRDLYNPLKNILLGTAYIKFLLKKYNNNFSFSVSAYNAGSIPVNKWKEELKTEDILEWIENIPYEETRTYVRLLIRNYIFYHNLLSDRTKNWFPDWIIQ